MTMPTSYALELYRGDTARRTFVLWADDEKTQPFDLAGATARAQIRRSQLAPELLVELACTITLPQTVDVVLEASSWPADECFETGAWDLELSYDEGTVQTIVAGPVRVVGDVTRAP